MQENPKNKLQETEPAQEIAESVSAEISEDDAPSHT